VRATAHETALALSGDLDQRIRVAVMAATAVIGEAEPESLLSFVQNGIAPMNLDFLGRHFSSWRQHFSGAGLPSSEEAIAEMGIEAGAAAVARRVESWPLAAGEASDGVASQAEKRKRRRRRRAFVKTLAPLTSRQTAAMHLIGEHKCDVTAAAGKSRQAMTSLYEEACKKLGTERRTKIAKTQSLPIDRREQSRVFDPRIAGPDGLHSDNE
jgi:hypothetical protein